MRTGSRSLRSCQNCSQLTDVSAAPSMPRSSPLGNRSRYLHGRFGHRRSHGSLACRERARCCRPFRTASALATRAPLRCAPTRRTRYVRTTSGLVHCRHDHALAIPSCAQRWTRWPEELDPACSPHPRSGDPETSPCPELPKSPGQRGAVVYGSSPSPSPQEPRRSNLGRSASGSHPA